MSSGQWMHFYKSQKKCIQKQQFDFKITSNIQLQKMYVSELIIIYLLKFIEKYHWIAKQNQKILW